MSEEQNTTAAPQVEEVADAKVQQEAAVETPVVIDKVDEPASEKPVTEESKNDEAPASADAVTTDAADEVTPTEEVAQEKPTESEKVEPESEKTVESSDDKALQENKTEPAEPAPEAAVVASNGDAPAAATEDQQQPGDTTEETNGVCKRKAENGSEVVEDEKSPKKAKIVDEADNQAPVEETAA